MRHVGGSYRIPQNDLQKSGYIKIVDFEMILPVLPNLLIFGDIGDKIHGDN